MKRAAVRIEDLPERYQLQIRAQLFPERISRPDALASRHQTRQRQPDGASALVVEDRASALLADPGGTLSVRIVRVGGRPMDSDNVPAGYKALRDALAAALGRRSDSEADGWRWEYAQEPGEVGTRIEIVIG